MKVVRDEPQQLLVLETPVVTVPPWALGCLGVVVLGLCVGVPGFDLLQKLLAGETPQGEDLLFAAVGPLAGACLATVLLWQMRSSARFLCRLRVDRYAGELEIAEHGLFGGSRSTIVPLDRLDRVLTALAQVRPSFGDLKAASPKALARQGLRLRFEWRGAGDRALDRSIEVAVDELDKREEVVDFAYRLARAAGLPYARVLRSDPRQLEMELARERNEGAELVPLIESAAGYAKDRVVAQAARVAKQEHIARFVPRDFRGDAALETWQPRQLVRFRKGLGFGAIGCLPFTLLVLAGPYFHLYGSVTGGDKLIASIVLGLFGLVFGGIAMLVVVFSLPRRVTLDWTTDSFERRGAFRARTVPLSSIRELELKCVATHHSSKSSSYYRYHCAVVAHLKSDEPGKDDTETIVETESFKSDQDSPYRMGLPLVTELAEALGVPRRITDFS